MLEANRKTIEDILSRSVRYIVPEYQRNFEWKKENAEEFWEDIQTNYSFLGTVVLNTSKEKAEREIEIVDGQQRLTTIFILLAALRTQAKNLRKTKQAIAIQNFITFIDNRTGEASIPKFVSSVSIDDVFVDTIANFDWDGKNFLTKNKKRQANKIKPIYDTFMNKISGFKSEDITNILSSLYSSIIVELDIKNPEEAFEIFERNNARGMDLNAADLLKNYLFAKTKLENVIEPWEEVIANSNNNILRMIKYFYVSKMGLVRKKDLFRELKKYGDAVGAEKMLEELIKFSRIYMLIIKGNTEDFITFGRENKIDYLQKQYYAQELNRSLDAVNLFNISQSIPLIIKSFDLVINTSVDDEREINAKKLVKLVNLIENFHFLNTAISQRPGNQVEEFYASCCNSNLLNNSLSEILKEVNKKFVEQKVGKQEFVERFRELNYKNDYRLIFYINDRLNNHEKIGGQIINLFDSDTRALRRNYDIDHLISQNTSEYLFEDEMIENYLHSIGNLLVISKHTNGSLQNVHITEKLKILKEKESKLPEVLTLISLWGKKKWETSKQAISNINSRTEDMAERAFSKVWTI